MRVSRIGMRLDSGLFAQRLIARIADFAGDRQALVAPALADDGARAVALPTPSADHVGEVGVALALEDFACALRAAAGKASHHQLGVLGDDFFNNSGEVIVGLHLPRPFHEYDRHIEGAGGMTLRELALGADIEVNRAGIFAEGIVSLDGLLLFDWHRFLAKKIYHGAASAGTF